MLPRHMFFRLLQSALAGLAGGAVFGAILAGIHSAAPGGAGALMGLILGGLSGAVLGLIVTALLSLALAGFLRFRHGGDWSAKRWRWTGFAVGAIVISLLHIVDIYIL
ncbi:MAG: hypothetical protein RIF32_13075 [Leptospirales bacterium]|jgi:MFS family permease